MNHQLAIKIDVDTERGTRVGVPHLANLLQSRQLPATFLFSLGPDNTGKAIKRIFRPGFLRKVQRTSVVSTYGWRTLINGLLKPGPHIGKKHEGILQDIKARGFEVGIHCYDHIRWQDHVQKMNFDQVAHEYTKALNEFHRIFQCDTETVGAAGWQANAHSLHCNDFANLLYASDCRGTHAFFPKIGVYIYNTLQIPTTLPTLDECLGRPGYDLSSLGQYYVERIKASDPNQQPLHVLTIHAELEGMKYRHWFQNLLDQFQQNAIEIINLHEYANELMSKPGSIPICDLIQDKIPGRSGTVAVQGQAILQSAAQRVLKSEPIS